MNKKQILSPERTGVSEKEIEVTVRPTLVATMIIILFIVLLGTFSPLLF